MASYQAIGAISQAICRLLKNASPQPEFAGAQFEVLQAADFQSSPPKIADGVAVYLYRVGMNGSRRTQPARIMPDGTRRRPPVPVDLHYLLTFWGRTAEKQQYLLGWCLRALHETPTLPAVLLNQFMPESGKFLPNEQVELACEPMSLQDMSYLWDGMRSILAVAFAARMVLIDSEIPLGEYPPVQTRVFEVGAEQSV